MRSNYQHNDEVIEAARVLCGELLDDSPFGNEAHAQEWLRINYSQVVSLANQTTEAEEERAVGNGTL